MIKQHSNSFFLLHLEYFYILFNRVSLVSGRKSNSLANIAIVQFNIFIEDSSRKHEQMFMIACNRIIE